MSMKKALKIGVIVVGSVVGVSILGLAVVGLGEIFTEQYHDAGMGQWPHAICQITMYGWDRKFNFGWCA